MKQSRLLWLLVLMVGLIVMRWWVPPRAEVASDVVAAVVKPVAAVPQGGEPTLSQSARVPPSDARDVAGDAFAVRVIRQAPPPPPPPRVKVVAFMGPPAPPPPAPPPPPPPPPPLQVLGTWDDGTSVPGVFVSTGQGTVLARPGTLLLAEYRVTAITAQQVSITHATTKHVWQLTVPRATNNR